MGNKTFWAGNQQYLDSPLVIGNIEKFEIRSTKDRFGFSRFNLIKLSG